MIFLDYQMRDPLADNILKYIFVKVNASEGGKHFLYFSYTLFIDT